ncbi:MAG: polysaccharide deacetylase family protein [Elusimicrobiales bacterium]|jgi:peptidoglycan/xylan/chitin deacetylase (PgdA/CDA1 family)
MKLPIEFYRHKGVCFLAVTLIVLAAVRAVSPAFARSKGAADPANALRSLYTPDYLALKNRILEQFKNPVPGKFGEFVNGVKKDLDTRQKVIALTFDACGGRHSGYNARLIEYLRQEKIPATLFVTGLWIDKNMDTFKELAKDPLFEIENHGLLHRTCSITGETMYGVIPTHNIGDVIDEMELNARKIMEITGLRPVFFRSATAYTDEASAQVAQHLGMEVVSYDILSGDAMHSPAKVMARNIISGARHGAVVIMHFNHPGWHEVEALKEAVPALRDKGYSFGKLEDFSVKSAAY